MEFPIFIPWSNSVLLKNQAKRSITIAKRKEDNGQPRLAPWCHFKKGEFELLVCADLVRILQNIFNPIFMKVFQKWGVWGFGGFFVVVSFPCIFFKNSYQVFILMSPKVYPVSRMDKSILSKISLGLQTQNTQIIPSEPQWKENRLTYVEIISNELGKCFRYLSACMCPLHADIYFSTCKQILSSI